MTSRFLKCEREYEAFQGVKVCVNASVYEKTFWNAFCTMHELHVYSSSLYTVTGCDSFNEEANKLLPVSERMYQNYYLSKIKLINSLSNRQ